MGEFDTSVGSTIELLLYVALAIVITLVMVVLYFVYQYWFFKKYRHATTHPDYEELRDLDGNVVQQANTICSVGAGGASCPPPINLHDLFCLGIRMDEAATRPKLQLLRTASLPTREELPTHRAASLYPRSESVPPSKSSANLILQATSTAMASSRTEPLVHTSFVPGTAPVDNTDQDIIRVQSNRADQTDPQSI
ncbi:hypothetical protein H257_02026 [Aphanomyces astaci]|uniref:Uncharacterized protein n=1 Tax=Aphanomyces astaci TaxID=112090 RepID=W4H6T4_APHAT|nr:hypothetical protein H257_02026 [Aphanomyces astaci]ETV87014.1 hypothetical protein H257_02026 [Aphanomyces astaci]|eukprot:XP_009823813.1 hypothetical protein H257_02026 [Aphanomyces astaci]